MADDGTLATADPTNSDGTATSTLDTTATDGSTDAGTSDMNSTDTSSTDTSSTDTSSGDAGSADASSTDASSADAGSADTNSTDSSSADTGTTDTSSTDTGTTDTSSADAGSGADAGTTDTSSADTGTVDTGSADAGSGADAGTNDSGSTDTGSTDGGPTDGSAIAGAGDTGSTDAGSSDAGSPDAGSADAGSADAGSADAGSADAGSADAGSADAGSSDAGSGSATDAGTTATVPATPAWLASLPAAPAVPTGQSALTIIPVPAVPMGTASDITLQYVPGVPAVSPSATAATQAICTAIDDARNQIGIVGGLHAVPLAPQPGNATYTMRGYQYVSPTRVPLRTSLTAAQALAAAHVTAGSGVTDAQIFQAEQDLWHDLSGIEGDPAAINAYDSVNVTWGGGFAAAGHLQALLTTLFSRSSDARQLFQTTGMWVQNGQFMVVDTDRQWILSGHDAERYIRCDKRLLSLFIRIGSGTVPAALLPTNTTAANAALVTASLDSQFIELIRPGSAGNFPAWAVPSPWTRQLRAGIAHNMHWGIVPSNWGPYQATNADPARVIRVMTWSVGQGSVAAFESQGTARFAGAFAHGAFTAALPGFAQASPSDPPNSRYISVNNRRLLVPQP